MIPTPQLPVSRIRELSRDADFLGTMNTLYSELENRIAARNPICTNRGNCCKFGLFGHQLFVTPAELAYFTSTSDTDTVNAAEVDKCPYQQSGLCTVREVRPLGCRIFFCDVAAQHWQPGETEATLERIKSVHDQHDIPYVYVEWLAALAQLSRRHTHA